MSGVNVIGLPDCESCGFHKVGHKTPCKHMGWMKECHRTRLGQDCWFPWGSLHVTAEHIEWADEKRDRTLAAFGETE